MKALRIVALLVVTQAVIWFGWQALTADDISLPSAAGPRPDITVFAPGDRPVALPDGPYVLHIWATWCPPCRVELPGLLDFAAGAPVPVLAVATDPDWTSIGDFVGDRPADAVRRTDAAALAEALAVEQLPVTWVIGRDGVRARIDGARDWRDAALRAAVLDAAR